MTLPIAPVSRPADLTGQTNGRLSSALLRPVPGGGRLHHLAARAWEALVIHAMAHGKLPLTYTHGGTYRDFASQERLFRSRYEIGGAHGGCKTWNGERWCKKLVNGRVPATAATPGTSNHGWGLAIDTAYDSNPANGVHPDDAAYIKGHAGWAWLLANAERFGFSWELQSEPWHIRYVAGDTLPQAVLDWERFAASLAPAPAPAPAPSPTPAPTPVPTPAPAPGGRKMQWLDTLRRGASGQNRNTVMILQALLASMGYSVQVDGQFGVQTENLVRWAQGIRGLTTDGVVGPVTWDALSRGPVLSAGERDTG
jgi:peptidoglycan hydrolase-like protein with peptidoglycan-binding domain